MIKKVSDKMRFIKDEEFIRGNSPMTKEEIRILAISKMELEASDRVLDIGGGTGSISIQASKFAKEVIAIEKDPEALETLYKNKQKFNADNLKIVEGEALEVEAQIAGEFDTVFVGGSGGNMEEILYSYTKKLKENGKIVLTFITIENLHKAHKTLTELGYDMACTQIQVSQTKGRLLMLLAQNPIFILWGTKETK